MILLLSGTSDGHKLTHLLSGIIQTDEVFGKKHKGILVSTLTEHGKVCAEAQLQSTYEVDVVRVLSGGMDRVGMERLIEEEKVSLLIDATHPYAVNVSNNAMDAARHTGIDYLRYERPASQVDGSLDALFFDGHDELVTYLLSTDGNVLLTTGSNQLGPYEALVRERRVYARILPTSSSIAKAEAVGLGADRIIAVQGPFSESFNIAMMHEWDIRYLVTKDSSEAGGFQDKLEASKKAGVKCLILRRPNINYGKVFSHMPELIDYLRSVK